MRINVNDLRKNPQEIEVDVSPRELRLAAEGFSFPANVTGHVRFQMVSQRILANGCLETRVETECVRCLARAELPIRAEVDMVFEKRPLMEEDKAAALAAAWEAESREIDYYDEEELDPTEAFRQLLTIELPGYPLCKKDCRGLCPNCGADLNQGNCSCRTTAGVAIGESDWKERLKQLQQNQRKERS
jgi:uncharacterized protein